MFQTDTEHETDLGNARRLVADHGVDLRFSKPWKKWLVWDGHRWRDDANGEVMRRAKETARAVYAESSEKHAARTESRAGIESMVVLAQTEAGIAVRPEDLDAAPWSLNVLNGTLDLRSGKLRDHHREDLLTKVAPVTYEPKAKCPTWLGFLDRVMAGDKDLVRFLPVIAPRPLPERHSPSIQARGPSDPTHSNTITASSWNDGGRPQNLSSHRARGKRFGE